MHTVLRNPQIYQTIFLMIIINLGINCFGLYLDYTKFLIIFVSTIALDMIFGYIRYRNIRFPYSWVNAWFGISFFLRTDILFLYVLAAFLAISSKYFFQYKWKHFLNPSNFWVFLVLVFFPNISWTNPLQWGKTQPDIAKLLFIYSLIIILGFLVVWIVNKTIKKNLLWLVLPFLCVHFIIYNIVAPTETFDSLLKWYTPSFFIFVFFMLTEPMISPESNTSKFWFAICTAVLPYILQYFINENYTHLASLFLMTLTLPVERYISQQKNSFATKNILYFCIFLLLMIILGYCICRYWYADLVFENRCRQLFCN